MADVLPYLVLLAAGIGALCVLGYAFSRRNAYRTDGIDNLGGIIRRWADRRVEANRAIAKGYVLRADEQHQRVVDGDPAGMFGEYTPTDLKPAD